VLLGLGRRQAVEGLRLGALACALACLPVAIGLVGQHAKCGQAAIGEHLAAILAGLLAAQQQAQRPCPQGTASSTGEQAAQPTRASRGLTRSRRLVEQFLTGFEQLVEQAPGVHAHVSTV